MKGLINLNIGLVTLFLLLMMIVVGALKGDLTNNTNAGLDLKEIRAKHEEEVTKEQRTETQLQHVRKKRGSLDPIIVIKPRRILNLKIIRDYITTMDNSVGFRTTFWPLKHRAPPSKNLPFWCLVWIFCWPLLCIYCATACGVTACFGKYFRKANCLLDSLGFMRTCCLMNFCFCCANRIAQKIFRKHVNLDDEPNCKPIGTPQSSHRYHGRGDNSRTIDSRTYDLHSMSLTSPFSRGANNIAGKISSHYSSRHPAVNCSPKTSTYTSRDILQLDSSDLLRSSEVPSTSISIISRPKTLE